MQKVFKWIEIVLVTVAAIGFMLLLTSTVGGGALLVLGLAFLSLLYFAAGYFQPAPVVQQASALVALVKILSGFALSVLVIGLLFKFMFWNGAAAMLLVGLPGTIVAAIIAFVLNRSNQSMFGVLRRSALWSALGLVLFFTSSGTLFEAFNYNDPVLVEKFNARAAHPGDSTYRADFDNYRRQQHSQTSEQ
jgi:hypothetical protein